MKEWWVGERKLTVTTYNDETVEIELENDEHYIYFDLGTQESQELIDLLTDAKETES